MSETTAAAAASASGAGKRRSGRVERRRYQTRRALVEAARSILAEHGNADVSIQEITDTADVGFGSFYNHFSSKSELFDAAVTDALEEQGKLIDAATAGIDDPAEVFATSVRLTGRLIDTHPELAAVLVRSGLPYVYAPEGLAPRALRDLRHGMDSGRFDPIEPGAVLAAAGGGLLALSAALLAEASRDTVRRVDELAYGLLRMLGLSAHEARDVVARPLPEAPASQ